jgi:hypothetical protein
MKNFYGRTHNTLFVPTNKSVGTEVLEEKILNVSANQKQE